MSEHLDYRRRVNAGVFYTHYDNIRPRQNIFTRHTSLNVIFINFYIAQVHFHD